MALKKDFDYEYVLQAFLPWGDVSEKRAHRLKDAHIKVLSVDGDKSELRATVRISSGEQHGTKVYAFVPEMDGPNFIAQAYEHLKTLPEFADAADC